MKDKNLFLALIMYGSYGFVPMNRSFEFAKKAEADRGSLFADMLLAPIMHTDCTNAKVNGKSAYVFICATPDGKV